MKICFELIEAGSGADIWTINLSRALRALGAETVINTYPYVYQFCPGLLGFKRKSTKTDVVHVNSYYGFVFEREIPLVVTEHHVVHEETYRRYTNLPQKIFHRMIYNFEKKSFAAANRITCVSDYTKNKVREVFGRDAVRIYNGVDTAVFHPKVAASGILGIPSGKTVLLFVGNLSRRKGSDMLPKITRALGDKFCLICTSGLRRDVERVEENIYIVGKLSQEELVDHYNSCDMFVFPTRLEGFGLGVAEAMACGKPVVATDCSSMPELVVDGKGGFLCEMDNVEEFAEKIRILAADPVLRKDFGAFNRERTERLFSLDRMAKDYLDLYESLLRA